MSSNEISQRPTANSPDSDHDVLPQISEDTVVSSRPAGDEDSRHERIESRQSIKANSTNSDHGHDDAQPEICEDDVASSSPGRDETSEHQEIESEQSMDDNLTNIDHDVQPEISEDASSSAASGEIHHDLIDCDVHYRTVEGSASSTNYDDDVQPDNSEDDIASCSPASDEASEHQMTEYQITEHPKIESRPSIKANSTKDDHDVWPEISEDVVVSSSPARDEVSERQKIESIKKALNKAKVDVTTLKQLAISRGGLINDELRKKAWPELLGADVENIDPKPDQNILHGHRDYNQVVLDVNRSLKRFPPGMEETVRMAMQDQLVDTIMRVLVAQPDLHYYQGYHDIVVTFLLVVGEDITFALMDKLSKAHLNDFMDQNMDKTKHMLNYLYPIIGKANPELKLFLERSEVGTIFCLPWLITWYGHVLNDLRHIVRLYDYFIACHPLMPIYLAAVIVLYRQEEVLAADCDMPSVHCVLSKIPDDLPIEHLCSYAGDMFIQYPPAELEQEAKMQYELAKLQQEEMAKKREEMRKNRTLQSQRQNKNRKVARQGPSLLARLTVWSLIGAFAAAVYAIYCAQQNSSWPLL